MEQNRADLEQVLARLQADLTAAEQDSNRLFESIEEIGKLVEGLLRKTRRAAAQVPPEIDKLLLEIKHENSKRHACQNVLNNIDVAINDFKREAAEIERFYQNEIEALNRFIASRK